jgi:aminomethyltransferase
VSDATDLNVEDTPEGQDIIQTLPLDAWHRARAARMVPFAGYEMPVQYEGIMAEHLWTRESAGLFDVSHMGQVVFTGDNGRWKRSCRATSPALVIARTAIRCCSTKRAASSTT